MSTDEWDWPPPRHRVRPTIEGRIERERVVLKRPRPTLSVGDRIADVFFRVIVGLYKIVFAVVLMFVVLAAAWLIAAIVKSI